jgi:hypothetical protein
MTVYVSRLFSLDPLIAEAKRRARRRRMLVAVAVLPVVGGLTAAVVAARSPAGSNMRGGGSALLAGTHRPRLDVTVDAVRSSFPANWQVTVEESHALDGRTTGRTRAVSAAPGGASAVFDLRGQGRYRIGAVVEPRDHSTGTGCATGVDVNRSGRYSVTIRLTGRKCSVVASPRPKPR